MEACGGGYNKQPDIDTIVRLRGVLKIVSRDGTEIYDNCEPCRNGNL